MSDAVTDYDGNVHMVDNPIPESIYQTILKVMGDVRAVGKDGYNSSQNFNFRGIDGVMNAIGPAFRTHGLIVIPNVKARDIESGKTKNGGNMTTIRLTVEYTFANQHGDTLTSTVEAEAFDTSDKGTAKAMSVALRTALLQVLALPTHDRDPDEDFIERGNPGQNAPTPAVSALPDNWRDLVDAAADRDDINELAVMEQQAGALGDAQARAYIGTKRLETKRRLSTPPNPNDRNITPDTYES